MKNLIWKKTLEINLVKLIKTVILCIDRFLKEFPKVSYILVIEVT